MLFNWILNDRSWTQMQFYAWFQLMLWHSALTLIFRQPEGAFGSQETRTSMRLCMLIFFIYYCSMPNPITFCFCAWHVWLLITGCQETSHDGTGSRARRREGRTFRIVSTNTRMFTVSFFFLYVQYIATSSLSFAYSTIQIIDERFNIKLITLCENSSILN